MSLVSRILGYLVPFSIDPSKITNPFRKMEAFVCVDTALQYTAKRAFVTYLKSIYMMKKRKDVFNIEALDYDSFAQSLGLSVTPRLRFLKGSEIKKNKIAPTNPNKIVFDDDGNPTGNNLKAESSDDDEESDNELKTEGKHLKMESKKENNDDFKSMLIDINEEDVPVPEEVILKDFEVVTTKKKPTTRAALVKKMLHKESVTNKKIKFDEEGDPINKGAINGVIDGIDKFAVQFKEEDQVDKQLYKEKIKAIHKEQKRKLKEQKKKENEGPVDDFGDSGSENDVDLSWLPDPDKVYGDKNSDVEIEGHDSNEDSDNEDELEKPKTLKHNKKKELEEVNKKPKKKRKLEDEADEKPKKKHKKKEETVEEFTTSSKTEDKKKHKKKEKIKGLTADLSVNEAEELALMLLQNK